MSRSELYKCLCGVELTLNDLKDIDENTEWDFLSCPACGETMEPTGQMGEDDPATFDPCPAGSDC